MPKAVITEEELIATLQRSSLPTLLTEGKNDLIVLRRLEDSFSDIGLSILPAGGRLRVLDLYSRRSEISNGKALLFLADLDTWVHSGVPSSFAHPSILFTDGYSIENDLYRDGDLERLLDSREYEIFTKELDRFLFWYALVLSRHLRGQDVEIAIHPNEVLSGDERYAFLCRLMPEEIYPAQILTELRSEYKRLIRGKSLLNLLLRQLSASKRDSKFSGGSLLEVGATAKGSYTNRIVAWISLRLNS